MKKIIIVFYLFFIFIFLLRNTSPFVNSGDSGEFITTSCILGIAHSPGYPLYSLLGKIFSVIIPFGNYAYRINIMNIIFTMLMLILILFWAEKILLDYRKVLIYIFSCGIFIFSESYLKNTIQTEVFVLNSLFCVVLIILSVFAINSGNFNFWYLISFLFSLSLGNHHTIIFLSPGMFYLLLKAEINFKKIIFCILFFLLGFSIYFVLPLRSQKDPYFDWGNTEKLKNLYKVILRKDYGTFQLTIEKPLERSFTNIFLQTKRFVKKSIKDLTIFGIVLVILSFYLLFVNNKKMFVLIFTSYLISGIGFLLLSNLPFEPLYDGILERFYILPNTIAILGFLLSLIYIQKFLLTIFLFVILGFGYNFYKNINVCNYRKYYLNYDYGINIFRTLPYNSLLFMDGGDDTFYTLGYLQAVEKRRKDVGLYDRGGLVFKSIYGKDFRSLSKQEKEIVRINVEQSFVDLRPIFYSTFNKNILPNKTLKYAGVLYFVESSFLNREYDKEFISEIYSYRGIFDKYCDYRSNALAPIYLFMEMLEEKNLEKKFKLLKYLHYLYPEIDWLKNNCIIELHKIGFEFFNKEDFLLSKNAYELILKIKPDDFYALLNLGVNYEKMEEFIFAEMFYKKAINVQPSNVRAYYNLGSLYWKLNRWQDAFLMFEKVLDLEPQNEEVKKYIDYLKLKIRS
ncbi:MAG: protein O-mannosyl-transferase family [Endomicrobiia bacterium]